MKVWKLTATNTLTSSDAPLPEPSEGLRKIRVTKVLITNTDSLIFDGTLKTGYPLIPGRCAVGLIADDGGSEGYKKGTRVLLHTYLPVRDSGTEKKDFGEDDFAVCGQTADGYLQDFVLRSEDEITPLPDSVSDDEALLLENIALAKATADAINVQKGQHVAVIGGDILGLIMCQLLIYRQAAPIFIDSYPSRLDFARASGVYYSLPEDEELLNGVGTLTGGRLTDSSVYITTVGSDDPTLPLKVCGRGGKVAFCGFAGQGIDIPFEEMLKKHLTLYGITGNPDNIPSAINLLVNEAIDLSFVKVVSFPAERAAEAFASRVGNPASAISDLNVIELI